MSKKIWDYIIAGLCILSGIYLIVSPQNSFANIVYFVGVLILISGIFKIVSSLINQNSFLMPGNYLFGGIINFIFGIILMNNSNATTKVIPIFIGIWLILNSASGLANYFNIKRMNKVSDNKELITYIIKLILGIVVFTTPIISIVFTGWIIGIILILSGIYLIIPNIKAQKVYKVKIK